MPISATRYLPETNRTEKISWNIPNLQLLVTTNKIDKVVFDGIYPLVFCRVSRWRFTSLWSQWRASNPPIIRDFQDISPWLLIVLKNFRFEMYEIPRCCEIFQYNDIYFEAEYVPSHLEIPITIKILFFFPLAFEFLLCCPHVCQMQLNFHLMQKSKEKINWVEKL